MLRHYDPHVREAATYALTGRDGSAVTDKLLVRLTDRSGKVRKAAAWALAERDAPGVTDALLNLMTDPEIDIRLVAVKALANQTGSSVTDLLFACLNDPTKDEVKEAAADILARRNDPKITSMLPALANHPSSSARRAVARVLVQRDAPEIADKLRNFLSDPAWRDIHEVAAQALARRGGPGDLLALSEQSRVISTNSLADYYRAAQGMASRVFRQLPSDSQASVRADLARLTDAILANPHFNVYGWGI